MHAHGGAITDTQAAAIATVGHSDRAQTALIEVLRTAGVTHLVDIRSYPQSRRYPWFNRARLTAALSEVGIDYSWWGLELGGKRRPTGHCQAEHPALPAAMAAFAAYMATQRFARACNELVALAARQTTALMCAERDPRRCHRWLVADYLTLLHGMPIRHWQHAAQTPQMHTVSAAARCTDDATLRYDRGYTDRLIGEGAGTDDERCVDRRQANGRSNGQ